MSTISAGTTTTTALVQTGDTTGSLVLATGSGATTALTLDSSQNASFAKAVNLPNTFGFKNRIINGGMTIDQRNAGASVTPANAQYTLDRWYITASASSKLSVQQNAGSVTPPAGFTNYLGITSLSSYTVGASELFLLRQSIEGYNVADLAWGTASAKTVTVSFWVRSSLTGTFSGTIRGANATRFYQFSYTISSANTWEQKSITISGDTSGAWLTDNSVGLELMFSVGTGSSFQGTAGSWSGTAAYGVTGTTSVVGTNGATFYITGVQLEVGSQATSFDFRSYGTEMALCQRYFWKKTGDAYESLGAGVCVQSTEARVNIQNPVLMRTTPTFGFGGTTYCLQSNANGVQVTSFGGNQSSNFASMVSFVVGGGGLSAGNGTLFILSPGSSNYLSASAEL